MVVLAEDEQHQNFVRRYLYRIGFKPHHIRFEKLPSSKGSGEQWVRARYAAAVRACRERSSKATTALVVVIDADTEEVLRRQRQLAEALSRSQMAARAPNEAVVHLIPKRNIETWVFCLSGEAADEVTDYKPEAPRIGTPIKAVVETFYEWSRPNAVIPAYCVPSLQMAIPEVQRLDQR